MSRLSTYTLDFKQSSVKLALESGQPVTKTARELGININTLHSWIKKYGPEVQPSPKANLSIEEEVRQLRKENARLKQERDILKKATAYFAKETQ